MTVSSIHLQKRSVLIGTNSVNTLNHCIIRGLHYRLCIIVMSTVFMRVKIN